mmetsp:Transcript_59170/g.158255  ORF Transcript_59170/g.158255 Transcript_59170/m.158255 type:complete len:311 (-) Transcript_59170:57-989(-)
MLPEIMESHASREPRLSDVPDAARPAVRAEGRSPHDAPAMSEFSVSSAADGQAHHDCILVLLVLLLLALPRRVLHLPVRDWHLRENERTLPPLGVEPLQVLAQVALGHLVDLRGNVDMANDLLPSLDREQPRRARELQVELLLPHRVPVEGHRGLGNHAAAVRASDEPDPQNPQGWVLVALPQEHEGGVEVRDHGPARHATAEGELPVDADRRRVARRGDAHRPVLRPDLYLRAVERGGERRGPDVNHQQPQLRLGGALLLLQGAWQHPLSPGRSNLQLAGGSHEAIRCQGRGGQDGHRLHQAGLSAKRR